MKKHVFIALTLVVGLAACSQPKENKEVHSDVDTVLMATTDVSAALTEVSDESPSPEEDTTEEARLPLKKRVLASDEAEQLFTQYDLAPLWIPNAEQSSLQVFNGFYGLDHYRIEMYFEKVEKDVTNSRVYHIAGKTRFKRNIVPFEGIVKLDSLLEFTSSASNGNPTPGQLFAATGTFELKEDANQQGAGVFSGKASIDFRVANDGQVEDWYSDRITSKETVVLLDGTWTSNQTGKTKPVLLAKHILTIAGTILEKFSFGEREVEVNPKYRSLGWDTYWSNEEWWHQAEI